MELAGLAAQRLSYVPPAGSSLGLFFFINSPTPRSPPLVWGHQVMGQPCPSFLLSPWAEAVRCGTRTGSHWARRLPVLVLLGVPAVTGQCVGSPCDPVPLNQSQAEDISQVKLPWQVCADSCLPGAVWEVETPGLPSASQAQVEMETKQQGWLQDRRRGVSRVWDGE